ncbi:MAG: carbon starvation protein A [Prevotellaceae bacterium]|nr:carbon starvation protein A [Candidatus Colivivens caballi]
MISFISGIVLLVVGYFIYGKFVEKVFGTDLQRKTCAVTKADGVDYQPLPAWRIFMIQFLNIAGLGPIFGAIMGAKFGPSAYLWIVLGTIFAGATHDFVAGMISLREDGINLPEIIGRNLGKSAQLMMRVLTLVLMVMVGAVFVSGPAGLLAKITPSYLDVTFWLGAIMTYYVLATLLPVDKLIGRIYPVFAIALLFMAFGVLGAIVVTQPELPELFDGLQNTHPSASEMPIFPIMFVSIACGAISGFHATQSPMMARCMMNERLGRPIFYGAMVAEGIVALIWTAAANAYYANYGMDESNASIIVDIITRDWLGSVGCILAMLGVVAAPITTGDTALRSARLIAADILKVDQKLIMGRLAVAVPIFVCTIAVLIYSTSDSKGFDTVWRYFSWANQVLAAFTLWACSAYFVRRAVGKERHHFDFLITFIPALFMTCVSTSYIFIAPEGFRLSHPVSYIIGIVVTAFLCVCFFWWKSKLKVKN